MKARLLLALLAAWALAAGAQTAPAQLTGTTVQGQPFDLAQSRGKVVKTFRGRIEPALWDDIAELVLN